MKDNTAPRHLMNRALATLALTVLPLAAANCGDPPTGAASGEDSYVLGFAAPIGRTFGESSRLGAELAVREINAAGGIDGRPLELRVKDDETDPDVARRIAQELADDPAVLAVVGHANSDPMMGAGPVYDAEGLPALATSATSPEIAKRLGEHVFQIASSDSANAVMLARAARDLGQRIAILYANDSYGRGLALVFQRALQENGVTLQEFDPYFEEMEDFRPYLVRLKRRNVDVVMLAGVDNGASRIIAQANAMGFGARFIGGDGLEALAEMGPTYDGTLIGMLFHEEMSAGARAFGQTFRNTYNREPDSSAATSYDAVMLIARAIKDGRRTRAEIRDYLANVGRPGGSAPFDGVAGLVAFDARGEPTEKPFVLGEIRNGKYELFGAK